MKIIRVIILLLFSSALLWISYCIITLPDLDGLGNKTRKPSISVIDKDNILVGSLGDVYGGLINSENISKNLINAVVVLEDKRFFNHFGVDMKGLSRALIQNLKEMDYLVLRLFCLIQ